MMFAHVFVPAQPNCKAEYHGELVLLQHPQLQWQLKDQTQLTMRQTRLNSIDSVSQWAVNDGELVGQAREIFHVSLCPLLELAVHSRGDWICCCATHRTVRVHLQEK